MPWGVGDRLRQNRRGCAAHAQGLSQTVTRIRLGPMILEAVSLPQKHPHMFILLLMLITVLSCSPACGWPCFSPSKLPGPSRHWRSPWMRLRPANTTTASRWATGEMGELVRAFNHMAADLETSRSLAESSSAQLTAANQAIEERRRELETIVETIPSGVITLDARGNRPSGQSCVRRADRPARRRKSPGVHIESLLPAECSDDLAGVIRRGHRMGAASTEIEFHTRGRTIHLAVTSARFELAHGQPGTVLVVEDMTELLRAQRQLAWKEVAQRVAHEIKNPLTPIALSAERIGRHVDRGQPDSLQVIRKCSEVILGCVGTLRTLVDQFSALAQFPAPQPRPCDSNRVAEEALAMFAGRLQGINVERDLEPDLPPVLADPDAIRRALANLIDNAAEAMQGSLLRVLGFAARSAKMAGPSRSRSPTPATA